jgi:LysM repeat protein
MKLSLNKYPKIIITSVSMVFFLTELSTAQTKRITPPRAAIDITTIKGKDVIIDFDVKEKVSAADLAKYFGIQESVLVKNNKAKFKGAKLISGEVAIHIPENKLLPKPNVSKEKIVQPYCQLYYTVAKGESMYSIAKKITAIDLQVIQKLNSLQTSEIKIGQRLLIGYLEVFPTESLKKTKVEEVAKPNNKSTKADTKLDAEKRKTSLSPKESAIKAITNAEKKPTLIPTQQKEITAVTTAEKEKTPVAEEEKEIINKVVTRSAVGMWDKGGAASENLFVLHNDAKIGSAIQIYFPMQKRKVSAKVLGRIPNGTYMQDIDVLFSPAVAKQLGILDTKAHVVISYVDEKGG